MIILAISVAPLVRIETDAPSGLNSIGGPQSSVFEILPIAPINPSEKLQSQESADEPEDVGRRRGSLIADVKEKPVDRLSARQGT